jgi:hypothetical protein
MSLGSIILQLFCGYNMWYMSRYFPRLTFVLLLLLLSSVSSLCRVSTLIFLRQTMSLGNTVLQLF